MKPQFLFLWPTPLKKSTTCTDLEVLLGKQMKKQQKSLVGRMYVVALIFPSCPPVLLIFVNFCNEVLVIPFLVNLKRFHSQICSRQPDFIKCVSDMLDKWKRKKNEKQKRIDKKRLLKKENKIKRQKKWVGSTAHRTKNQKNILHSALMAAQLIGTKGRRAACRRRRVFLQTCRASFVQQVVCRKNACRVFTADLGLPVFRTGVPCVACRDRCVRTCGSCGKGT